MVSGLLRDCLNSAGGIVALSLACGPAWTQVSPSPEARASDLRAAIGSFTTPDRELNVANLEAIVTEGDASKSQLAIRMALTGEGPLLRSVATRAYLAATKTIVVETLLPPEAIPVRDQTLASGERLFANSLQ
jgi:hypothetical protein